MKNPKQFAKLFNYGEDIGLANDGIFFSIELYLCAGVLTNDNLVVMTVKVGDKVITSKYSGTEVKADGVEYIIVKQSDILAIVE